MAGLLLIMLIIIISFEVLGQLVHLALPVEAGILGEQLTWKILTCFLRGEGLREGEREG